MAYTTIDKPDEHFNTIFYTGANPNASQSITGVGFQPDWIWIKSRTTGYGHCLVDTVRGATGRIQSDTTSAESHSATYLSSIDSDGFSLGVDYGQNAPNDSFVAWNWLAGGLTPTKTYKVVVVSDSGNKYRFRNSADTATFGQSGVTLSLQEGGTYVFDWSDSSAQGHPIRFSTTSDGTHGGGSEYTTGVVKDDSAYKTTITVPASAPTLYYYCSNHSGMGGQINTNSSATTGDSVMGAGQTNFDGSSLSQSHFNKTAGFSVVKYQGTGGTGTTFGHDLDTAPEVVITKPLSGTTAYGWRLYFKTLGATNYLNFNNAVTSAFTDWNNTHPTSTVFTVSSGSPQTTNESGTYYIAYCFTPIKGYSKFGSYEANNSTDGQFIYTGFKPALFILKSADVTGNWFIFDNKRDTDNVVSQILYPDLASAEGSASVLDFLSNGVKLRNSGSGGVNYSGTYIYMAFAEHPFVSSEGVPTTAR